MTDPTQEPQTEWLVDAVDPRLTPDRMARVADPGHPDRLTWNTFRTLSLWNADAWVPSLVEMACGADCMLGQMEWDGAEVKPWTIDAVGPDVSDVVIDGPGGYLVVVCTLDAEPSETQLRAAAVAALDGSMHEGGREAGLIVVGPPGAEGIPERLRLATEFEVHDGKLLGDLLAGSVGSTSWPRLGRLVLDLAEEGGKEPMEQVHQLVTELQTQYPDANL